VSVYAPVLAAGFTVAIVVSPAAAQSPPDALEPHGFVEPCTIGNVQEMYTECELCAVRQGASQVCIDRFAKRGYEKKCQTHGDATTWGEVWCIDKRLAQEKAPPSKLPWVIGLASLVAALGLFKWVGSKRSSLPP
jgi:hypothetical protein